MVRAVFKRTGRATNDQLVAELGLGKSTLQAIRSGTLAMDAACQTAWHQTFGKQKAAETVLKPSRMNAGPDVLSTAAALEDKTASPPKPAKQLCNEMSILPSWSRAPAPTATLTLFFWAIVP